MSDLIYFKSLFNWSFYSILIFVIFRVSKKRKPIWITKIGSIGILNRIFLLLNFFLFCVSWYVDRTNCEIQNKVKNLQRALTHSHTFTHTHTHPKRIRPLSFSSAAKRFKLCLLHFKFHCCVHTNFVPLCLHSAHIVLSTSMATTTIEQIELNYASASCSIERVQVNMNLSRCLCNLKCMLADD